MAAPPLMSSRSNPGGGKACASLRQTWPRVWGSGVEIKVSWQRVGIFAERIPFRRLVLIRSARSPRPCSSPHASNHLFQCQHHKDHGGSGQKGWLPRDCGGLNAAARLQQLAAVACRRQDLTFDSTVATASGRRLAPADNGRDCLSRGRHRGQKGVRLVRKLVGPCGWRGMHSDVARLLLTAAGASQVAPFQR